MRGSLCVPVLLASGLLAPSPSAGELERTFKDYVARMKPGEMTTAFVLMAEQVELPGMVAQLDRMNATRAFRHELVVRSLQQLAATTQPAVAALLGELARTGEVESQVAFWIFNGFAVRGTRAAIERIAAHPATGWIYHAGTDEPGTPDLIQPVLDLPSFPLAAVPETGLIECAADYVWGKGFTGANAIACNIDTGVDGNHNALRSRWRGLVPGVPAAAAWFDPVTNTTFPRDRGSHGSHTMGTICGDDKTGNLIGMAPDARWIAANPIDAPGTRAQKNIWYNAAIQWTADPDGNPATVTDVPDVSSNSWGVRDAANGVGPCSAVFNAALDAAEASTVVYVWAAGNEGATGPRVPADRIDSPTNSFSVGALNAGSLTIASFSSRGPSPCDRLTKKPEVSARGVNVRSSTPNNNYAQMSGTSMACPHVAGAVVLLRDVWSEITVTRVKELLMETADDLGAAGEDNDYGHGRINLMKAFDKLVVERPPVAIATMGTRTVVKEGGSADAHVVLSSYSQNAELVEVSLELYFKGQPTTYYFIPPIQVGWPASASNRDFPALFSLPIPTNLPVEFIGQPFSIRGIVRRPQGPVLSTAEYAFTISR